MTNPVGPSLVNKYTKKHLEGPVIDTSDVDKSVGVYRVRTKCLVPGQSPIYSEPSSDYQSNSKHSRQSPNYNEPSSSHLQTNSKNARRSLSYSREPSNVYQSDSKHFRPSTSYNEPSSGHSETNSKHSRPSPNYINKPSGSGRQTNSNFQDRVLRQLSHIKLHLFKLDEKLSALNYPSLQNTNVDIYDANVLENFTLQYEQDLQNVEIKLKNDDIYKSNMLTALSKMGGSKTDEATKYILKKIYADKLAMCYSWMGGKGKKVLSTMILPKIIIEVALKRINNCTEIDIVNSIKNWLRHAYQRN
eukprot:XP_016658416.1 PREDICTED: uncharacterized protein LOC107883263 [Acyrthosiphon pisum]